MFFRVQPMSSLSLQRNTLAEILYHLHIVRCHDYGYPSFVGKLVEKGLLSDSRSGIKVAGRFVCKNQFRLVQQCLKYYDTLLFASAQLMRHLVAFIFHSTALSTSSIRSSISDLDFQPVASSTNLRFALAERSWKQLKILKYDSYVSTQIRNLLPSTDEAGQSRALQLFHHVRYQHRHT